MARGFTPRSGNSLPLIIMILYNFIIILRTSINPRVIIPLL